MTEYWPWWLGAIALAGITLGFWAVIGHPLGVSGSWARIIGWRESHKRKKMESLAPDGLSARDDALLAATLAEFGEQETFQALYAAGVGAAVRTTKAPGSSAKSAPATGSTPWTVHLTFLLSLWAGGLFAALATGAFQWHFDLGQVHAMFFGSGAEMWFALLAGGAMVGFGTQMGGGCTSGHGLSGCSRLVPASLAATSLFFGSAVAVSILVEAISK